MNGNFKRCSKYLKKYKVLATTPMISNLKEEDKLNEAVDTIINEREIVIKHKIKKMKK